MISHRYSKKSKIKEVLNIKEKIYTTKKWKIPMLCLVVLLFAASVAGFIDSGIQLSACEDQGIDSSALSIAILVSSITLVIIASVMCGGFKLLNPNEALVLNLFGRYKGTLKEAGFYYINPFSTAFNPAASTKLRQSGCGHQNKCFPSYCCRYASETAGLRCG